MKGGALFVLGSHVRHIAVGVRTSPGTGIVLNSLGYSISWAPLCRQRSGSRWRIASTPAQNAREVCTHCIREAARIARAVL